MSGQLDVRFSGVVSVGTSTTVVLDGDSSRMKAVFSNDGANVIYLQYSLDEAQPTAVVGQGIRLAAAAVYVEDDYKGPISAIAVTGATNLCVMEL
jgi:hypothetical protein